MAPVLAFWTMTVQASSDAAHLIPSSAELPASSGLLKILLLFTFFIHLILVNILLGSVLLAILDRRASATNEQGGVAFMPKVLALAVNFGIAPFLFLQVLYGNFLYPTIGLMAVWWLSIVLFVMLAYSGLYVNNSTIPSRRVPVLVLVALLLLMAAFLLTNASTLMIRPDLWLQWFSSPHGTILNWTDPTLFPRYLHILLASLAVGGLTLSCRARWSQRAPQTDTIEAERRFLRGLDWFFYASLAQIPVGLLFLFTLPPAVRWLFLGEKALPTAALALALVGLALALILARQGSLKRVSAVTLGTVMVMVCVRDMVREAMILPYSDVVSAAPSALAMPIGQTAALGLFLICMVLAIASIVWLSRVLLQRINRNDGSGTQEG